MFDDHDQVRKGGSKSRFCGVPELSKLAFNALAVEMTTAGIPCVYYGTEQSFDSGGRPSGDDAVLRENMFGGRFGGKRTQNVHHFNEDAPLYQAVAKLADLRKQLIALRRGRQFLHEVSGDGEHFGEPAKLGERLLSLVTWSRVMGDQEFLLAINTDENNPREMWTTLNPNQRTVGESLDLLFSYALEHGVEDLASTQYAPRTIAVEVRNNVICARLKLGPAGFAIYSAGTTKRRS
jgi:glycosidase